MGELRSGRHSGFIESENDIRLGVKALRRKCPYLRRAHDLAGDPPLRRRAAGFEGLARIIVGQQLSVSSAEAIWGRTVALAQPFGAAALLALDDAALRSAGLSRGKILTLRAAAEAVAAGRLDFGRLALAPSEELRAALIAVRGIGPWTADIFDMFCLGRRDAFAPGDLALQVAAQMAMRLDARPGAEALAEISERWRPWRGVAARLLWTYYKVAKEAKAAVPV
jgi:DNA-3-methyladenine glycosylase II